jgi:hypothetical protein
VNAVELLPVLRQLFSRHPEMRDLEAYHLAWILFALRFSDRLEDEHEIDAARVLALTDWTGGEAA